MQRKIGHMDLRRRWWWKWRLAQHETSAQSLKAAMKNPIWIGAVGQNNVISAQEEL